MVPNKQLLLDIVSSFIKNGAADAPADAGRVLGSLQDPEEFFRLANDHCLDSIVYACCRNRIEQGDIRKLFRNAFQRDVFYYVNRREVLREMAEEFSREKIPFLCMKGMVLSEIYPVPELRSMGDIDIVIHTEDREAADRILREKMGYSRFIDNHAVWTYYKKDPYLFEIEVHDHMFYEELANRYDYRGYFDRVWEHCQNRAVCGISSEYLYVPDLEFHFLYLITHMAKHIINNGNGFRAYIDIIFVSDNIKKTKWPEIEKELESLSLLKFTKTCMSLCERWFGKEMPLHLETMDEELYRTITEKTFHDGIFGLKNEENVGAVSAKTIRRSGSAYYVGAIKRTINKLFPPYKDMQLIEWYSFVDGRPWLLPAAWVYRWGYCLVKKREHSIELLEEPFKKKSTVTKRQQYLENWGL